MFSIALVPSVLLAVGMVFSPESPRWLYQQGKIAETEVSIKRLYGKERVAEIMGELDAAGQGSFEPEAGWFDLFSSRYRKVVSVGAALFLFQQFAGINAVVYFSTSVFRSAGITSDVAASALVGAANVFVMYYRSLLVLVQCRLCYFLRFLPQESERKHWLYFFFLICRVHRQFNMSIAKRGNLVPLWEVIECQQQPDGSQCGFYVMRYMKDIIENKGSNSPIPMSLLFNKGYYSRNEIDEVRMEWADFVNEFTE